MYYPLFFSSNRENPEETFVYIEKKIDDRILFDFFDSNEFAKFANYLGFPDDWEKNGSMIELLNYRGKRIQKGVIYKLNLAALQTIPAISFNAQNDSLILAYTVDLSEMTIELFGPSVAISKLALERFGVKYSFTPPIEDLKRKQSTDKVVVRKIGQGNWNELYYKDKVHTIFDSGTIYSTSNTDLIKLIGNRNLLYQKSKPIFILSHWDVDHYHFLLALDDATIQSFEKFVFRNKVPSLTARKVMGRFATLNPQAPFPVDPENRARYTRGTIRLIRYQFNSTGTMELFNAQENRSRNKSGIGLLLRTEKDTIVFSGDFNYDQLDHDMLPSINYRHENHYLIVPHHGGKAGRILYGLHNSVTNKKAIISVGRNPYKPKHPYQSTITTLITLGFSVRRTDLRTSDYIITL